MTHRPTGVSPTHRNDRLARYHRFHAYIYDLTRWSFLFGRTALIEELTQLTHWMRLNHVRMDAHLAPKLKCHFRTRKLDLNRAYAALWRYFLFIGEN